MGAYLAVPVTDKERFEGQGIVRHREEPRALSLVYGGAAMQGWRRTMEDAHIAQTGLHDDTGAIFGVFDGHGGAEVALFCQKYMAGELERLVTSAAGGGADPVEAALTDVFHRMDEMLRDHSFADEIEKLRGSRLEGAGDDEDKDGDDGGLAPMDALEMIKRVFQLKRFMGEGEGGEGGGEGSGGAGTSGAGGGEAGDGPTAMDDDGGAAGGEQRRGEGGGEGGAGGGEAGAGPGGPRQEQQRPPGGGSAAGARAGAAPAVDPWIESAESRIQAGCTAVVAVIKDGHLYVANAGDSRGVLCRGGEAVAMSEDHKPAHETERSRILNAGGFLSEIGGVCRVNGNLNLSRAIGDLKYKTNQTLEPKDQIITAQPDIRRVALQAEDEFFLLACDGVWDVMTNQEAVDYIRARLEQGLSPTEASCQLLDACLASDPKEARGVGCDNMTAIVVQLRAPAAAGGANGVAAGGSGAAAAGEGAGEGA